MFEVRARLSLQEVEKPLVMLLYDARLGGKQRQRDVFNCDTINVMCRKWGSWKKSSRRVLGWIGAIQKA